MMTLFEALAPREDLYAVEIDGVDGCAVIGEEGCEGATDDFRAVDDCDGAAKEAVTVWEDTVVDAEIFEDFDHCEGRTGEDGFLGIVWGVEEADVLVHVEDVAVGESFDVFVEGDELLDVLVLAGGEDGVVDDYAVDGVVGVGRYYGVFEVFFGDFTEVE